MDSPWTDEGAVEEAMEDLRRAGVNTIRDKLPELPSRQWSFGAPRSGASQTKMAPKKAGGGAVAVGGRALSLSGHGRGGKAQASRLPSLLHTHGRMKFGKVRLSFLEKAEWHLSDEAMASPKGASRRKAAVFVSSPLCRSSTRALDDPLLFSLEAPRGPGGESATCSMIAGEVLNM